jgi:Fe-S-cluster containining protein
MPIFNESNPLAFFKALHLGFGETLAANHGSETSIMGLMAQACDCFEENVELQCDGLAALACRGGCDTCCTLRVAATTPEILTIVNYIRSPSYSMTNSGFDLAQRIADADLVTRGLDEAERLAVNHLCPFIEDGLCVIYEVRPLACRGHASYDEEACLDALAGRTDEVPISVPHMTIRSFVQNAMQSALRDAGYAWGSYELNQAVQMALTEKDRLSAWLSGGDVFEPALVADMGLEEMAETFDAIKAQA